jgi:hypothetical protein
MRNRGDWGRGVPGVPGWRSTWFISACYARRFHQNIDMRLLDIQQFGELWLGIFCRNGQWVNFKYWTIQSTGYPAGLKKMQVSDDGKNQLAKTLVRFRGRALVLAGSYPRSTSICQVVSDTTDQNWDFYVIVGVMCTSLHDGVFTWNR